MLKKLFSQLQNRKAASDEQAAGLHTLADAEWQDYEFMKRLFQIVFETESILHNEEDSLTIAIQVMKAACDLYEADWCGILIADLQTQAFIPEIWYEVGKGPMKETLFNDIEFTEEFATWAQHLVEQKPLFIPDVEQIKEMHPKEYEAYQRLDARAIMGVPFGQHPLGFMVVRNMKRYGDRYEPLQLACFVAMMMLEQIRRQRMEMLFSTHEEDDGKLHIRFNILGPHNVVIDGREIYENELPHPNRRAWIVLLYLVLHRQPVDQAMLIADNWPDEPEDKIKNSLRQSLFRLHNELSAYHDVKVVDARGGQMKFSNDVRVTTDAEEMELLYRKAMQAADDRDKIELLKKAFSLYRGRLFLQGENDVGGWLMTHTYHYNQLFVDVAKELLRLLGHRKDFHCIMEYAPVAIEKEPGMQEAYYWTVVASDEMGNGLARDNALARAKTELLDEEYEKLERLLTVNGHLKKPENAE